MRADTREESKSSFIWRFRDNCRDCKNQPEDFESTKTPDRKVAESAIWVLERAFWWFGRFSKENGLLLNIQIKLFLKLLIGFYFLIIMSNNSVFGLNLNSWLILFWVFFLLGTFCSNYCFIFIRILSKCFFHKSFKFSKSILPKLSFVDFTYYYFCSSWGMLMP